MITVMWGYSKLVKSAENLSLDGGPMTWGSQQFPFTVPAGKRLHISDLQFGSKFTDGGANARASYFIIDNVITMPDNGGSVHFRVPIPIPEGVTLNARFINNDAEQQWMTCMVTGRLEDI